MVPPFWLRVKPTSQSKHDAHHVDPPQSGKFSNNSLDFILDSAFMSQIILFFNSWCKFKSNKRGEKENLPLKTPTRKVLMKKTISIIAALVLSTAAFATETPAEKEVQVGISGAFVPGGFDSTSEAYVVVNGVFQNGCYKWSRADVTSPTEFSHEIRSMATVTQGMCIMVLIPFQKDVRLGKLATGKHSLKFLNGDGTYLEKSLVVE
jgi:hypothetical protein